MTDMSNHSVTVTFREKEWYILSRLLAGFGQEAEHYVHDIVVGIFDSDIDLVFGHETPMNEELHRCEKALKIKVLPGYR